METQIALPPTTLDALDNEQVFMSAQEWVQKFGSGTLRYSFELQTSWRDLYLHERVCWFFGVGFEIIGRSRVMFGDVRAEGDCSPYTESVWHSRRYFNRKHTLVPYAEMKYINVEYPDGTKKEGIGLIVRETVAQWLPPGHLVFAIVAEYSPAKGEFLPAENPA